MTILLKKRGWEIGKWFGRSVRTVSAIRNWHLSKAWAYSNVQNRWLCLMIIPLKIRGWEIRRGFGWLIRNISTIINWHISEVWAYYNGQNCGLCQMRIFGDIRDLEISSKICHWHLTPENLSVSQWIEAIYEGEGCGRPIAQIVWNFEVKAIITTRLIISLFHNRNNSCLWQEKIGVIWNTAHSETFLLKHSRNIWIYINDIIGKRQYFYQ